VLIRAGIVGPGGVGRLHLDALRRLGIPIAGVASETPALARSDAKRLGIERVFDSADELAASDDVDVVHVCAPNYLHLPICRAALTAGKHVVAEKPLCTTTADAEALLLQAEEAGVVHAVCYGYRCYPMIETLRLLISGGELGGIHAVAGSWLNDELLTIAPDHWMLDPVRMGPSLSLADIGVHWWDLVEYVTGGEILDVLCETRTSRPGGGFGEDLAVLALRLTGETVGTATVCQTAPGHGNTITLEAIGSRATATWDIRTADLLTIREPGGTRRVLERASTPVAELGVGTHLPVGQPEGHAEALLGLFRRVYDHIRSGETVADHPTFADGVRGLRILEALRQSARDRKWVDVDGQHS
jgi:predicted dehydrogenase